ncbi:MAG: glucan biosynthesis protein [Hyphomicrobium sp.]
MTNETIEIPKSEPSRRELLLGAGATGLLAVLAGLVQGREALAQQPAEAAVDPGIAFQAGDIAKRAEELAAAEFAWPKVDLPAPFDALTAEQYRDIRFRPEATLWRGEQLQHELQFLPYGWIYNVPVDIFVVDGGMSRRLIADGRLFSFGPAIEMVPDGAPLAFSGFRLLGPINRSDLLESYALFQGASYFRSVGRGQGYGLSARGLAVNTAQPGGEEFPMFRGFWIEKPAASAAAVVVHALLDSPSVAGAYKFTIEPGVSTTIDVEATLYARKKLPHAGLAPLTSMFLHGGASRHRSDDVRPAVHDSEGLAMLNGQGERLWRPLTNPMKLQTSAFIDAGPRGFGLAQRDRAFTSFEDLDARYERRPTVWIEPKGSWGAGYVELIEIPAAEQIHDNIVAYWKPAEALEPGKPFSYAYRLTWGETVPVAWTGAQVRKTRVGKVRRDKDEHEVFVVDFDGAALEQQAELPRAELAASAGTVAKLSVARHPEIEGVRVSFELAPGDAETIELRLGLKLGDQLISESWLFRWTKA